MNGIRGFIETIDSRGNRSMVAASSIAEVYENNKGETFVRLQGVAEPFLANVSYDELRSKIMEAVL